MNRSNILTLFELFGFILLVGGLIYISNIASSEYKEIKGICTGMSNENLSCSKVYEKSQCLCCEVQYLCIKDVCGSKTTTNCVVAEVRE